jgi:hypothetical protein
MKPCDLACIRRWRALFMMTLLTSGPTAVPLESGPRGLAHLTVSGSGPWSGWSAHVAEAVGHVGECHPMRFYGTDWLAFAHVEASPPETAVR